MQPFASHWTLDPDVVFLNHGSFGACPKPVLEAQAELRARLEREPVALHGPRVGGPHGRGADGARPASWAPTPTPWRSSPTPPWGSTRSCARSASRRATRSWSSTRATTPARTRPASWPSGRGARVVVAHVPFPLADPGQVTSAILERVTPRTQARPRRPRDERDRPRAADRGHRARSRRARRRHARRRRARAGDGAAGSRRAGRRLLHRQLPQVDVHAQGVGLPLRARGPSGPRPSARDQPRAQRASGRTAAASGSSSTSRERRTRPPGS